MINFSYVVPVRRLCVYLDQLVNETCASPPVFAQNVAPSWIRSIFVLGPDLHILQRARPCAPLEIHTVSNIASEFHFTTI